MTTIDTHYDPHGVGVEYPFKGRVIKCLAGQMTVRGTACNIKAKTVSPKLSKTKPCYLEVWLVLKGCDVVYLSLATNEPGKLPLIERQDVTALARVAYVAVKPGQALQDADGQIVTLRPITKEAREALGPGVLCA